MTGGRYRGEAEALVRRYVVAAGDPKWLDVLIEEMAAFAEQVAAEARAGAFEGAAVLVEGAAGIPGCNPIVARFAAKMGEALRVAAGGDGEPTE